MKKVIPQMNTSRWNFILILADFTKIGIENNTINTVVRRGVISGRILSWFKSFEMTWKLILLEIINREKIALSILSKKW